MPGHEDRIGADARAHKAPSSDGLRATASGPSTPVQRLVDTLANGSRQVARIQRIQAMADRSAVAAGAALQRVVQRVRVNGVDITAATPLSVIVSTLGWNHLLGSLIPLDEDVKQQLIQELKNRDDCKDLRGALGEEDSDDEVPRPQVRQDENEEDIAALFDDRIRQARRRQAAEAFGWEDFPEEIDGLIKLGVHETGQASVSRLVALGPLIKQVGTGRGSGKGPGFYVTHVGERTLYNATKGIEYGESFVAVYVPGDLDSVASESDEEDSVETLAKKHPQRRHCYYVMSGGSEIVVPTWCFQHITVVARPEQLVESKERRRVAWNTYEDEVWFAGKLNELSTKYNAAAEARRRQTLRTQWNRLQKTLFNHWSLNASLNTLWLDTSSVGTMVPLPSPPSFD